MSAFSERVAELTGAGEEAMERLAGGDVSGTLRVTRPEGGTVVAKGGMTAVEAMMLRRLAEAGVPVPPIEGEYDGVLLLGFVENDELFSPRAWADLGAVLRRLHGHSGEDYGWPVDFAAGSVLISNRPSSDWGQFWADERLLAPAALLDRPWRERVAAARPPADADWGLAERVALDDRIDRAFGRQRAFEQGEVGDLEGRAGKASRSFEQIADMARTALEASERDVGKIGALIGRDADPGERGIDLLVQGFERLVRRDAGPARLRLAAPLERADARQRDREGRVVDRAERGVNVVRAVPVNLADEAQGEMELVLALPASATDAAHRGEEQRADRRGRADGDEEAVHGIPISSFPRKRESSPLALRTGRKPDPRLRGGGAPALAGFP